MYQALIHVRNNGTVNINPILVVNTQMVYYSNKVQLTWYNYNSYTTAIANLVKQPEFDYSVLLNVRIDLYDFRNESEPML